MTDVNVSHYPHSGGIHVEVIIDNGNGDVVARSVDCEVIDRTGGEIAPKEELPDEYEGLIRRYLEQSGYSLRPDPDPLGRSPAP